MAGALDLLKAQLQAAAAPAKAARLQARLTARQARLAEAEGALADGECPVLGEVVTHDTVECAPLKSTGPAGVYQDAIEGCTALLKECQPSACSGYYCRLLRCRCAGTHHSGFHAAHAHACSLTGLLRQGTGILGTQASEGGCSRLDGVAHMGRLSSRHSHAQR